jgi:hypothetical protein
MIFSDVYINAIDSNVQDINNSLSLSISKQDYSQTKKRKNKKGKQEEAESFEIQVQSVNEMIDPNEPLYCTCKQVSFGRMVACESENCKIEWFHFECVGLKNEPTDTWYCPDCLTNQKELASQSN